MFYLNQVPVIVPYDALVFFFLKNIFISALFTQEIDEHGVTVTEISLTANLENIFTC